MERVDVVGVCGGEVLRGLRGEDLLRRLLRLRRGEGGREVGVLEVPGPDAVTAPGEPRRRDAVAAQSLLQFGEECSLRIFALNSYIWYCHLCAAYFEPHLQFMLYTILKNVVGFIQNHKNITTLDAPPNCSKF